MAFDRVSGNNNLANGNFSPIIYSQKVQKFFRTASVIEAITNTDYAGEIEAYGDTVNIIKEPTISVSAYSRGAVVDAQDITDDQIQLTVDQANAFSLKLMTLRKDIPMLTLKVLQLLLVLMHLRTLMTRT